MSKDSVYKSLKSIDKELQTNKRLEPYKEDIIFILQEIKNVLISEGSVALTKSKNKKINNILLILSKRLFTFQIFDDLDKFKIWTMSYGSITKENQKLLIKYLKDKKVLEIFAGNGYLSNVLKSDELIQDYLSIDNKSSYLHSEIKLDYGTKNISVFDKEIKIKSYDVIIMSWPPQTMDPLNVLKKMKKDQILIYLGEWEGCTANKKFHKYLNSFFFPIEKKLTIALNKNHVPRLWSKDYWYIFQKL